MLPVVPRRRHVEGEYTGRDQIRHAAHEKEADGHDDHAVDDEQFAPVEGAVGPQAREHAIGGDEQKEDEHSAAEKRAGPHTPGTGYKGKVGVDRGKQRDTKRAEHYRARGDW